MHHCHVACTQGHAPLSRSMHTGPCTIVTLCPIVPSARPTQMQELYCWLTPTRVMIDMYFMYLTREHKCPVYWLVPPQFRKKPDAFISHAWDTAAHCLFKVRPASGIRLHQASRRIRHHAASEAPGIRLHQASRRIRGTRHQAASEASGIRLHQASRRIRGIWHAVSSMRWQRTRMPWPAAVSHVCLALRLATGK